MSGPRKMGYIYPFFDQRQDSLPPGENIPTLIFDAVKKCRVGVVILSEEYFTRTKWPMLELVAMVNSKLENTELIIIPVFLGISREQCRDVMNQRRWKGVWDGWASFDSRIDVEEWLRALEIFGPTKGICFDGLSEVKCRQEIVDAIRRLVPTTSSMWNDSNIQGRSRFCNVRRTIPQNCDATFQISSKFCRRFVFVSHEYKVHKQL